MPAKPARRRLVCGRLVPSPASGNGVVWVLEVGRGSRLRLRLRLRLLCCLPKRLTAVAHRRPISHLQPSQKPSCNQVSKMRSQGPTHIVGLKPFSSDCVPCRWKMPYIQEGGRKLFNLSHSMFPPRGTPWYRTVPRFMDGVRVEWWPTRWGHS